MKTWTEDDIRKLGATVSIVTAGEILGIGRTKSYELAARNEFPVPVLRVGRRYIVPTHAIKKLLHVTVAPPETAI